MKERQRAPCHDQAAIAGTREGGDAALDPSRVAHIDRAHLHPERRRRGLDRAPLAVPLRLYSKLIKPVALPPGRDRLSTKPAPTGSATATNTIGTVRVACNNGGMFAALKARMTLGARATSSAANCRALSASPAGQR